MAKGNQQSVTDKGFFSFLVYCLGWLLLCIVFGIVIEWFAMTMYYPHEGVYHSLRLLESELSYLENSNLITTGYGNTLINKLLTLQQSFYVFMTQRLHLESSMLHLASHPYAETAFNRLGLLNPEQYAVATLNMMQVMTLRMVIVVLSMPIFLIMLLWALGEGLTRRAIRVYQVRAERAFLFHHAKRLKFYSWVIPITVYLAWPNELSPITVFAPFALIYAFSWMIMAAKFKRIF